MSASVRRSRGATLWELIRTAMRFWRGDDDYARYLERCAVTRQVPLDRGRYFAQQLEERYRRTTRCC